MKMRECNFGHIGSGTCACACEHCESIRKKIKCNCPVCLRMRARVRSETKCYPCSGGDISICDHNEKGYCNIFKKKCDTIELWPFGDSNKRRLLGVAKICNDLSGDSKHGNYTVDLSHAGKHLQAKKGTWKSGRVEHHLRKLSPYHLVCKALKEALGLKFKEDKNV